MGEMLRFQNPAEGSMPFRDTACPAGSTLEDRLACLTSTATQNRAVYKCCPKQLSNMQRPARQDHTCWLLNLQMAGASAISEPGGSPVGVSGFSRGSHMARPGR